MALKNCIKEIRLKKGLSQVMLADKCGLTQNTISAYECGVYGATVVNALKIASALDCHVEDLFSLSVSSSIPEEDFCDDPFTDIRDFELGLI